MYQHVAQNGRCIFRVISETVGNSLLILNEYLCNDFYENQVIINEAILRIKDSSTI